MLSGTHCVHRTGLNNCKEFHLQKLSSGCARGRNLAWSSVPPITARAEVQNEKKGSDVSTAKSSSSTTVPQVFSVAAMRHLTAAGYVKGSTAAVTFTSHGKLFISRGEMLISSFKGIKSMPNSSCSKDVTR